MTFLKIRDGRGRHHDRARLAPWRRLRRVALLATAICLVPAGFSYVQTIGGPHNVGLGIASVEWMRAHGGNGVVSQIEDWYYTLTAPAKGGPTTEVPAQGWGDRQS